MITKLLIPITNGISYKTELEFSNKTLSIIGHTVEELSESATGFASSDITSYTSYLLVKCNKNVSNNILNHQTGTVSFGKSDILLVNLNIISSSLNMGNSNISRLLINQLGMALFQIDTGLITSEEINLTIRPISISPKNIIITSPDTVNEIEPSKTLFYTDSYVDQRLFLWDNYAIYIDGVEMKANNHHIVYTSTIPPINMSNRDYIDINIKKFTPDFLTELTRDVDDDIVSIESTCGLLNTRKVKLKNGVGTARLYNFGYTGQFELMLGYENYPKWNLYNLQLS